MIRLYNSLTRDKQEFTPIDPQNVRVYACGPTVYNYAHIGNARPAVVFDLLVKLLRHDYAQVVYVSNITDVDDKIMAAAAETGDDISTITQKYTDIYNADMAALGVAQPDIQPLATQHIDQMIALCATLIDKGNAYEAEGHVLFNVPSYDGYGALSGRNRDEQIAGARVEVAPYKRDAADFVLWKPSSSDQPGWESPWGRGRPGWHIECSAMAREYLGDVFDIHGGGIDLTFPHHENERAQSCCALDVPEFAKIWMHNGFLTVEGEKMSKSTGNVLRVHDLIDRAPGEALRLTLLAAHYRQPLDWTQEGVERAVATLDKFYEATDGVEAATLVPDSFLSALRDDLNTPQAIAALHGLYKAGDYPELKAAAQFMGLLGMSADDWFQRGDNDIDMDAVETLLAERLSAKDDKDYARADAIRDELISMGVSIKDTVDGTEWSVA